MKPLVFKKNNMVEISKVSSILLISILFCNQIVQIVSIAIATKNAKENSLRTVVPHNSKDIAVNTQSKHQENAPANDFLIKAGNHDEVGYIKTFNKKGVRGYDHYEAFHNKDTAEYERAAGKRIKNNEDKEKDKHKDATLYVSDETSQDDGDENQEGDEKSTQNGKETEKTYNVEVEEEEEKSKPIREAELTENIKQDRKYVAPSVKMLSDKNIEENQKNHNFLHLLCKSCINKKLSANPIANYVNDTENAVLQNYNETETNSIIEDEDHGNQTDPKLNGYEVYENTEDTDEDTPSDYPVNNKYKLYPFALEVSNETRNRYGYETYIVHDQDEHGGNISDITIHKISRPLIKITNLPKNNRPSDTGKVENEDQGHDENNSPQEQDQDLHNKEQNSRREEDHDKDDKENNSQVEEDREQDDKEDNSQGEEDHKQDDKEDNTQQDKDYEQDHKEDDSEKENYSHEINNSSELAEVKESVQPLENINLNENDSDKDNETDTDPNLYTKNVTDYDFRDFGDPGYNQDGKPLYADYDYSGIPEKEQLTSLKSINEENEKNTDEFFHDYNENPYEGDLEFDYIHPFSSSPLDENFEDVFDDIDDKI